MSVGPSKGGYNALHGRPANIFLSNAVSQLKWENKQLYSCKNIPIVQLQDLSFRHRSCADLGEVLRACPGIAGGVASLGILSNLKPLTQGLAQEELIPGKSLLIPVSILLSPAYEVVKTSIFKRQ